MKRAINTLIVFALLWLVRSSNQSLFAARDVDRGDRMSAQPQATIYYVDAVNGSNTTGNGSASAPWRTISYALSQAAGTEIEIHVAPGVYDQPLGESFPITMRTHAKLVGAGYTSTVISGVKTSDVVIFPGTAIYTRTTEINGFKVTNGNAGIRVDGPPGALSSPWIHGNWITGNELGIYNRSIDNQQVYTVIEGNLISGNIYGIFIESAGGAQANPTIIGNRIIGNTNTGIRCHARACCYSSCDAPIIGNVILDNGGWGIDHSFDGWFKPITATIVNNLIAHNSSGGVHLQLEDNATFVNNTVAYNNAYGIYGWGYTTFNCIVWGNGDDLNVPATQVYFSDVSEVEYAGTNNNISQSPRFADPDHGDYHVLPTSPVRDAGSSSAPSLPGTDLDGDPRILGGAVDIGADETITYNVSIAKSVWPTGTVYLGDILTYTLALSNTGPASAGGVLVTDTLPAGTTWTGIVRPSTGYATVTNETLLWLGTLPRTDTQTIAYSIMVNPNLPTGTLITNTAVADNRTGGITTTPPVTVTVGPRATWNSSYQVVDKVYAQPGQTLAYSIVISNTGNAPANDAVVTDTLDNHVLFSASAGGVFDNGRIIWSGLTITNGTSVTLNVVVTVTMPLTDATPIVNRIAVAGGGRPPFDLPTATTTVYNPPQAGFAAAPSLGPVPFVVTFTNSSQHATSLLWLYGDGLTSTIATTHAHTYSSAGVYTVTLQANNPVGSDTLTRTNYITAYNRAVADFTGSPRVGLWPLQVTFTNTSRYADRFIWNYGDGFTSTVTATIHTHTYATPGSYDVSLVAIGPYDNHIITQTAYIAVYDYPIASFSGAPTTGVAPLLVQFTNYSINATSYRWDFGDGSINFSTNPQHLYLNGGVYTVTLTASNPGGSDTLMRTAYITVHSPPLADFYAQPTAGLVPLTVTLSNTSQYADTYLWDYGDGVTSTVAIPTHTHTYPATGSYTVSLKAINPYGTNVLTRVNYIAVYTPPVAGFDAAPLVGVAPLQVSFTNTSQYASSFWWSFGDGSTSTSATPPPHTYMSGGVYTVSLRASNPGGSDWLTYTHYITVHNPPLPDFVGEPRVGFGALTTTFTNTLRWTPSSRHKSHQL